MASLKTHTKQAMTTTFRPGAIAAEYPSIHAGIAEGQDCLVQAIGLMHILDLDHRLVLGSFLLNAVDHISNDMQSWQRPWLFHSWIQAPDGTIIDPALLANIGHWCEQTQNSLPRPATDLEAVSIQAADFKTQSEQCQQAITTHIIKNEPHPQGVDLIYLPGLVFNTSLDAMPFNQTDLEFWAAMAHQNFNAGGLGFEQAIQFMDAVPRLRKAMKGGSSGMKRVDLSAKNGKGQKRVGAGRGF